MTFPGIFVTGTDTAVGKTFYSAILLAFLRARGIDAVPMKPIQTGAIRRNGRWHSTDLDFCLALSGLKPSAREYARMAPFCFAKACSPHLAAAIARRPISLKTIVASFDALRRRHSVVIVEGAGGVLVPLNARKTMLDLMRTLALPTVVVARTGLGTLNHTLLTLKCLRHERLRVLGVVFNTTFPGRPGYIERDNVKTIARLGNVRVLGSLPFLPSLSKLSADQFRREMLDVGRLL
ncbi:MAG: dethiobiotin synthase [Lentisphaerae bacterium]|nr:dethiobiotin synthase [Lentisphaerota bacterium]